MMRVALVNCRILPEPDPDEAPGLAAFRSRGHEAQTLAWDDPAGDPGAFDVCLLRATWNYVRSLEPFLAWADRADAVSRLIHHPSIIRWNAHKGYLRQLAELGVPIVPTRFVARGDCADPSSVLGGTGWSDVVLKPAVGAGSFLTRRFRDQAAAAVFLAQHARERDMLVQRYMASVESMDGLGERSLVWIGGEVTHAVEKLPRFAGEAESVRGRAPREAERRFAEGVVDTATRVLGERPVYARVDVMTDDAGESVLSELELIEPSLYLDHGAGSGDRLVRAVEAAVGDDPAR